MLGNLAQFTYAGRGYLQFGPDRDAALVQLGGRMTALTNVLWIGGPAGAGKTTVARQLARRHGLRWYNTDTHTWEHRDRALAQGITLPERGPGIGLYDRRQMIIDDLLALPVAPLILAEGGTITPDMARPSQQAAWLLPSKEVQRRRLQGRHPEGVPEVYFKSWDHTKRQLEGADVHVVVVDELTVEETIVELEQIFQPRIMAGPTAATVEQRRELIRFSNQAIVAQHTSPLARPEKRPVDPATNVRLFDCECGVASCTATIETNMVDAASAILRPPPALLALGHH